jgi:dynein light intermediate chain 1
VPGRNPFPFPHRPNALDRDRIIIPAGWDSWGKIAVLRDSFDSRAWGEAWERDLASEDEEPVADGALSIFGGLVPDQSLKVRRPLSRVFCPL